MAHIQKNNIEVFPIVVPVSGGLKTVNFFLVKQEDSFVLIDAGFNNDECWQALQAALKNHGYKLSDLTEILLTHHHIDHIGLVNRITAEHPIPVYAHPHSILRLKRDPDFLQRRIMFYTQLYKEMGCGARGDKQVAYLHKSVIQNENQKLDCEIKEITENHLCGFEVVETFGHAPDQVAFYQKEQKWLFGGDVLIGHISSNALVEPDSSGNRMKTLIQHKHSLEKCLSLQAELVFSGHGRIVENPADLIEKRIKGIDEKAKKFKAYIGSGIATASEIAQAHYKEQYDKQFSLVMSEIIGHLDYLEEEGSVYKELDKGIWRYFVR